MTTMDTAATATNPAPKHGYTKDGIPVWGKVHHFAKADTAMQRFNARFGLKITSLVGTMWVAYLFACIAIISLPSTIKQHNATVLVALAQL
jgi:hypothetical protein